VVQKGRIVSVLERTWTKKKGNEASALMRGPHPHERSTRLVEDLKIGVMRGGREGEGGTSYVKKEHRAKADLTEGFDGKGDRTN